MTVWHARRAVLRWMAGGAAAVTNPYAWALRAAAEPQVRLSQGQSRCVVYVFKGRAEHPDRPLGGLLQQNHLAQQRGLARTTAANHRKYLGTAHRQVHTLVHHMIAKTRHHLIHLYDCFSGVGCAVHVTGPEY